MKLRTIQTMLLSVCLSACMTAFTGCSEKPNEQPETSSGDSSIESAGEYSTESSETSSEDTPSESSEPQIFDEDDEIYLDQENLKTIDQDRLWVAIWLEDSYEAVREEYDKLYPDFDEDDDQWHHWIRFLHDRFIQIGTDFLSDYGIDYDDNVPILSRDISVSGFVSVINGKFDKDTISLMLDDPRVWQIVYRPHIPYVPMYGALSSDDRNDFIIKFFLITGGFL